MSATRLGSQEHRTWSALSPILVPCASLCILLVRPHSLARRRRTTSYVLPSADTRTDSLDGDPIARQPALVSDPTASGDSSSAHPCVCIDAHFGSSQSAASPQLLSRPLLPLHCDCFRRSGAQVSVSVSAAVRRRSTSRVDMCASDTLCPA